MLLSILIPNYNRVCVNLVKQLHDQCVQVSGLNYEIIVADDGSTRNETIIANDEINAFENCKYIVRNHNVGRAAIRNYLHSVSHGDILIFMDSDVVIRNSEFINTYIANSEKAMVVCGGVKIEGDPAKLKDNLRYKYEKSCEGNHTAEKRQRRPYMSFRTTNFLIHRSVMEKIQFDEDVQYYGYEDVLFGKALAEANISMLHIDNPVNVEEYDDNDFFLRKTQESLASLKMVSDKIGDYSKILNKAKNLKRLHLDLPIKLFYKLFDKQMIKHIVGKKPSVKLYNIYRLAYLLSESGSGYIDYHYRKVTN